LVLPERHVAAANRTFSLWETNDQRLIVRRAKLASAIWTAKVVSDLGHLGRIFCCHRPILL